MPVPLPDTPAGRQVAWFLHHSETRGAELTVEEIAEHMRIANPGWTPEGSLERFRNDPVPNVTNIEGLAPFEAVAHVTDENGQKVLLHFWLDEAPPHRIYQLWWVRDVGDDVVIREAREEDAPALRDLERRSPLQVGDALVTYDRGDDFFAHARLMEETVALVAEERGEVLALECAALHPVVIDGKEYRAMLIHHLRIPREHQKRGLYSPLNMRCFQWYGARNEAPYGYVAIGNAAAGRLHGPDLWTVSPLRGVLRCDDLAGLETGRPATPADAERIVGILNTCHEGEAMYRPYTVESLTARLERAPELYSWDKLWMTDRAIVGVWPAGLKVTREEGGRRTEDVRASALDHGFLPGAEYEFEGLLRAWCGWLAERGTSELAVYTSEGSPNYGVVSKLASQIDAYDVRLGAPEPEDAAQRGFYVDAVYF